MSKINPFVLNLLASVRQETMLQIAERGDPDLDITGKQLQLKETMSQAIMIAKSSPKGEVSIVITGKNFPKNASAEMMMQNSKVKVSFWNTDDFNGHLTKTVIFIDAMWSQNFRVFRCSMKLDDSYLIED